MSNRILIINLTIIILVFGIEVTIGQNLKYLSTIQADTISKTLMPGYPLLRTITVDSHYFSKALTHYELKLEYKPDMDMNRFYNPKNVIPDNPLMLDYRTSSYYTPKIVQDRLDFFMNRPRSDSFVPIPVVAILAAKLAMKYVDIEKKIEINPLDYIVEKPFMLVMKQLWERSPQTADQLYEIKGVREDQTYELLTAALDSLIEKKLVKRREIEGSLTQYFAAQNKKEVVSLIQEKLLDTQLASDERTFLSNLLSELKR